MLEEKTFRSSGSAKLSTCRGRVDWIGESYFFQMHHREEKKEKPREKNKKKLQRKCTTLTKRKKYKEKPAAGTS